MINSLLEATVAIHLVDNPGETRSLQQLEAYYKGLMDNSPFAPLAAVMEHTPRVMEMRINRSTAQEVVSHRHRLLGDTYAFLLRVFGDKCNIRIDTSFQGHVAIFVSNTKFTPNYAVKAYLDMSDANFEVWFDRNVKGL